MSHVIIRGENGRRHEVDLGTAEITVSMHASTETVNHAMETDDPSRPSYKRHVALVKLPRHRFSKTMATSRIRIGRRQPPSGLDLWNPHVDCKTRWAGSGRLLWSGPTLRMCKKWTF